MISGLNEVLRNLERASQNIIQASETSLTQSLTKIAEDSLKVAPKDTGDLRKSMLVKADGQTLGKGSENASISLKKVRLNRSGTTSLNISYDTKYAVIQHEIKHKNYTTAGTGWKYLENPFNKHVRKVERDLAKSIKEALK